MGKIRVYLGKHGAFVTSVNIEVQSLECSTDAAGTAYALKDDGHLVFSVSICEPSRTNARINPFVLLAAVKSFVCCML